MSHLYSGTFLHFVCVFKQNVEKKTECSTTYIIRITLNTQMILFEF